MIYVLAFLFSFCSLSYKYLILKSLEIFPNEVLQQSLTLGIYLLFLGIGAYYQDKKKTTLPYMQLKKIEIGLIIFAALTPIILNLLIIIYNSYLSEIFPPSSQQTPLIIILAQLTIIPIAFFSGRELPLLFAINPKKISHGKILGISYIGGLASSLIIPSAFINLIGALKTIFVISYLNFLGLLILALVSKSFTKLKLISYIGLSLIISLCVQIHENVNDFTLKTHYAKIKLVNVSTNDIKNYFKVINLHQSVHRIQTKYQTIDIIEKDFNKKVLNLVNTPSEFTFFLNHQQQFSSNYWRNYHESFLYGALNLSKIQPQNILILGGGDGILASLINKEFPNSKIDLVELDKKVVEISNQHSEILNINNNIFSKNKINLHFEDAFSFLRKTTSTWDAVFVDFPFPVNYTISKLYSKEFYKLLLSRISTNGFFIFDAPIWKDLEKSSPFKNYAILASTLNSAGATNHFAFGPIEPFIFVSKNPKNKIQFDYASIPKHKMSNRAAINLNKLDTKPTKSDSKLANSLMAPKLLY